MVILKARRLSFVVLVFIANLSGVDDRFDKGVCDWSCAVENANATGEAIRNAIAEGRLLKLTIKYMERVDSARCANETKLDTVIFNTTATVWLKPSIDYQMNMTKGSMASITQAMLDVIFSGQIFTGSYIEMKVSCFFEPTLKKNSSTNVIHQRLRPPHNPLSILYYVENLASYTKTNSTLVLMKANQQSRISLVITGAAGDQSPYTSAKENELLTFSDDGLAFVAFICIIICLYSPSIFLFLRPSKGKVKLPKDLSTSEKHPVENSGGNDEDQSDTSKDEEENHSGDTSDSSEGVTENDEHNTEQAVRRDICEETTPPCNQVPKLVAPNPLQTQIFRTRFMPIDVDEIDDNGSLDTLEDTRNFIMNLFHSFGEESNNTAEKDRLLPDTAESPDTPGGPCGNQISLCSDESDQPASVEITIAEPNHPRQPSQSATTDGISKFEHTPVIIVGDTNPLGVGSFIGNSLFSSRNICKILKAVKLIICLFLPYCFIGLGDLLLIILTSFPKRVSINLPSPFLFDSMFHSTINCNHLVLLCLVVLSAICHFIRLLSEYFSSGNYEKTRVSCPLHSKHFICVVYMKLQSLLSKFPQPFCGSSHWIRDNFTPVCDRCKENSGECSQYFDVPENVLLTLEKQASIAADYWNTFAERCASFDKKNKFNSSVKILVSILTIILLVFEIIYSSPLICLWHGHRWFLREKFKTKFKGLNYMFSFLDIVISVFSLFWLIFSWGIYSTVPLGVLIVGFIKTLASKPSALLPEVIIVIFSVYYLWSCYSTFTMFYYDLVKELASSYQKKYNKQEKQPGRNFLINYEQGKGGHSIKVIPEELFESVCQDRKLLISKKVLLLLARLFFTFISFFFVWSFMSIEVSLVGEFNIIITFFAVGYPLIHSYIKGKELEVFKEDVDKHVDNYIRKRKESVLRNS